jgi:hypothetical protein
MTGVSPEEGNAGEIIGEEGLPSIPMGCWASCGCIGFVWIFCACTVFETNKGNREKTRIFQFIERRPIFSYLP